MSGLTWGGLGSQNRIDIKAMMVADIIINTQAVFCALEFMQISLVIILVLDPILFKLIEISKLAIGFFVIG